MCLVTWIAKTGSDGSRLLFLSFADRNRFVFSELVDFWKCDVPSCTRLTTLFPGDSPVTFTQLQASHYSTFNTSILMVNKPVPQHCDLLVSFSETLQRGTSKRFTCVSIHPALWRAGLCIKNDQRSVFIHTLAAALDSLSVMRSTSAFFVTSVSTWGVN